MSANLLRQKEATIGTRSGVQSLLPLTPTGGAANVPDTVRHQCMDLLVELLKTVASAENNSTEISEHERR